jgi:hypothetical protein
MRAILIILCSVGLLAAGVRAQGRPLPGTADTFSLSGTVTEVPGMLPVVIPVSNARIIVYESNLIIMGPITPVTPLDTAYTDSTGAYLFKSIVASYGVVSLQVSGRGYHDTTLTLVLDTALDYSAQVINPKLRKIAAKERCLVNGQVLAHAAAGPSVTPVPNARVSVTPDVLIPLDWGWGYGIESYEAVTDSRGYFSIIAAVTADTAFILTASCDNYQTYSQSVVLQAADTVYVPGFYMDPVATAIRPSTVRLSGPLTAAVYPHPARSQVTVALPMEFRGQGQVTATLFDLQGRPCWSRPVQASSLQIPAPAPGLFLLLLTGKTGTSYCQTIQFTE